MRLAEVVEAFRPDLEARYGARLLPGHRRALDAILRCRTEESGSAEIHCPACNTHDRFPLSCGIAPALAASSPRPNGGWTVNEPNGCPATTSW
jgi:hypothetical protein